MNLWSVSPDGSFVVHDYLDFQRSKEQVEQQRRSGALRQSRHRAKSGVSRNGSGDAVSDADYQWAE